MLLCITRSNHTALPSLLSCSFYTKVPCKFRVDFFKIVAPLYSGVTMKYVVIIGNHHASADKENDPEATEVDLTSSYAKFMSMTGRRYRHFETTRHLLPRRNKSCRATSPQLWLFSLRLPFDKHIKSKCLQ